MTVETPVDIVRVMVFAFTISCTKLFGCPFVFLPSCFTLQQQVFPNSMSPVDSGGRITKSSTGSALLPAKNPMTPRSGIKNLGDFPFAASSRLRKFCLSQSGIRISPEFSTGRLAGVMEGLKRHSGSHHLCLLAIITLDKLFILRPLILLSYCENFYHSSDTLVPYHDLPSKAVAFSQIVTRKPRRVFRSSGSRDPSHRP
jgi:hypothetical protein